MTDPHGDRRFGAPGPHDGNPDDDAAQMKFFGLLVTKGHLSKEDVLKCLQVSKSEARPLSEVAVDLGVIDEDRLDYFRRTGGEDIGRIPGVEILAKAGVGGTASVFKAREKKSGRVVALKVLHAHLFSDTVARGRFLKEARLLIDLEHENIVKGFKVGRVGEDRLVFVMEFIEGDSCLNYLNSGHQFHEDAALYVILQAARALEFLRQRGLVHRDIKPDNIMLTRDNTVKLIDLGFATSVEEKEGAGSGDTTLGTVHYISPEQARGGDVDIRSDIYSLGAALYQLVVGKLPFEGEDQEEVMAKQILESLSSPELRRGNVSPYMRYFLEKMMAKDPDIRYQSPIELIQDIEEQIRGKKTAMELPRADGEAELLEKPFEDEGPGKKPSSSNPPIRRRRRFR